MAAPFQFIIDPKSPVQPTEPGTYIGCMNVDSLGGHEVVTVTVSKKVSGPDVFPDLSLEEMAQILEPRVAYMRAFQEGYKAFTEAGTVVEKLSPIQLEGYLAAKEDIERCLSNERDSSKGD